MRERGIFINGHWEMHSGLETFTIFNPATGDRVGSTLLADAAIVDRAVGAAHAVRADFEAIGARARGGAVRRVRGLAKASCPPRRRAEGQLRHFAAWPTRSFLT